MIVVGLAAEDDANIVMMKTLVRDWFTRDCLFTHDCRSISLITHDSLMIKLIAVSLVIAHSQHHLRKDTLPSIPMNKSLLFVICDYIVHVLKNKLLEIFFFRCNSFALFFFCISRCGLLNIHKLCLMVDEEEETHSTVSSSSLSSVGLPGHLLKQLALDIEAAGGIVEFDKGKNQGLNHLLDQRNLQLGEVYGQRGSDLRRKISQKVAKWKKLDSTKYLTVLAKLGVTPKSAKVRSSPASKLIGITKAKTNIQKEDEEEYISDIDIEVEELVRRSKNITLYDTTTRINKTTPRKGTTLLPQVIMTSKYDMPRKSSIGLYNAPFVSLTMCLFVYIAYFIRNCY